MSQTVTIAGAQMGPSSFTDGKADKKENVRRILRLLDEALQEKVKIICFPELCLTDYFAARMEADFEGYFDRIPNELTRDIFAFTRQHPISVILPFAEYDGIAYYNSAGVIQAGELLGTYRKVHLPAGSVTPEGHTTILFEKHYFTPGNLGYPVFDLQGAKVGVQICYDRMFPEGYRTLALKGAEIVFNPTAATYRGSEHRKTTWETFLKVRAFENNLFVVGVNKAGTENTSEFPGDTMILNPLGGALMAKSETKKDELVIKEIDLEDVARARKFLPAFRDRRPSEYALS